MSLTDELGIPFCLFFNRPDAKKLEYEFIGTTKAKISTFIKDTVNNDNNNQFGKCPYLYEEDWFKELVAEVIECAINKQDPKQNTGLNNRYLAGVL